MSETKVTIQLVLINIVNNKKVCRIYLGEYVEVHKEDELCKTIDINHNVGAIVLGSQYNLQGQYFESLLTDKFLQR